jgi:hypothetical protein
LEDNESEEEFETQREKVHGKEKAGSKRGEDQQKRRRLEVMEKKMKGRTGIEEEDRSRGL